MNPFTRSLVTRVKDSSLVEFVRQWDELEALIVRVYRANAATPEDEAVYTRRRAWLLSAYAGYRDRLNAYWPRSRIGRQPTPEDPFARLLAIERAADLVDNWDAMQTLPAARESLNLMLLDAAEA